MLKYFMYYLLLINLISLSLCWYDKRAAIRQKWRIKESTLLLSAALGGSVGFYVGMKAFRHKTKHLKFTVLVPLLIILQSAGLIWFFFYKNT